MAKTLKQLQPHKFSAGDTVKVVRAGRTEWCKIGDIHKIRVCKTCPDGEPVYVVNDDHESCWIRECNLELVDLDRQKGGEWKRHRGGKCPVHGDQKVEVKLRDGDIQQAYARCFAWPYDSCDTYANIMQYRVISQPQAEGVEVNAYLGDSVKLEISHDGVNFSEIGAARIDNICDLGPVEPQWQQSTGPLAWRDTIIHCQAIIEDCEREIERNVALLDSEGLMLKINSKEAMTFNDVPAVIPFAEWRAGDIVEVISTANFCNAGVSIGDQYPITNRDSVDVKGPAGTFGNQEHYKFIRRP